MYIIVFEQYEKIDPYKIRVTKETIHCRYYWENGGLTYAKINEFQTMSIETNKIIKIMEL